MYHDMTNFDYDTYGLTEYDLQCLDAPESMGCDEDKIRIVNQIRYHQAQIKELEKQLVPKKWLFDYSNGSVGMYNRSGFIKELAIKMENHLAKFHHDETLGVKIDLSDNYMSKDIYEQLVDTLKHNDINKYLQILDVRSNNVGIGVDTFIYLGKLIDKCPKLEKIVITIHKNDRENIQMLIDNYEKLQDKFLIHNCVSNNYYGY